MFFPFATDAPLYHWPVATLVTIIVNVIVFGLQLSAGPAAEPWMLHYDAFNPVQWLTSMHMHGGFAHLLGNMLSLWVFGMIVEGKVGPWLFLVIYHICGISAAAVIQIIALSMGLEGMALGASCAIFGIMAVSMVWAPENEISYWYAIVIFFRPYVGIFEVAVWVNGIGYLALNLLSAFAEGFSMGTATAHLIGAVPGFLLGFLFVKSRWVNCEGWDLLSIWSGTKGQKPPPTAKELEEARLARLEEEQRIARDIDDGKRMIGHYLERGQAEMAVRRFELFQKTYPKEPLPESLLAELVREFNKSGKATRALELIEEYLRRDYPDRRQGMLLLKARILLENTDSPRKALRTLQQLDLVRLSVQQRTVANAILKKAQRMIADGHIEVDTESW